MAKYKKDNYNDKINNSKILLLLKNQKNTELLSRFLDANYETYKDLNEKIDYDLILIDSYNYQTKFKKIEDCKKAQYPIFLPVILLHKKDDIIDYTSKNINIADEYILTPIKKDVLKSRIRRLLKTRILTKEAYYLEDKFDKVFNNINDSVLIYKVDLQKKIFKNFTEVNNKVLKKLGYDREKILEISINDLISEQDKSFFNKYFFNKLKKDQEVTLETKMIKENGQLLSVQVYSKIIDINGENFVLTIINDNI
ncbi:MAG: PAS domain-containing protein [Halanaerobiales bacterium]|nr:PAS domain-containing protein [Halanaerobiales bacterium]